MPTNAPASPAPAPADDTVLVLSSGWHLRPDHGGGLVYRYSHDESLQVWLSLFQTAALVLSDGRLSLRGVRENLRPMLGISDEEARETVETLLELSEEHGRFWLPLAEAGETFTRPNGPRILRDLARYKPEPLVARRLEVPLALLAIPSYRCQTDCIYCYAQRPPVPVEEYMTPRRWGELLVEAGEAGVDMLAFSGGDPMTYDGLELLLVIAQRYQMSYLMPTKTLITRRRADELAPLLEGYGQLQVSVDSLEPAVADHLMGVRGYAERARATVRNLRAAGVPVRTNTVVTPYNLPGIEALVRELHELGVYRAHITNYYRSHYRHSDDLFLSAEQVTQLNDTVRRLSRELDWSELSCNAGSRDFSQGGDSPEVWAKRASCSGGFSACTILPDGNVVLCEQVPADERFVVGNVKERSLLEVWNSQELLDFIVPDRALFAGTPCAECDDFDRCHREYGRCFRDAFFTYGRVHAPAPSCPRATPGLRMS